MIRINHAAKMIVTDGISFYKDIPEEWAKSMPGIPCPIIVNGSRDYVEAKPIKGWTWVFNKYPMINIQERIHG